MARKINPEWLIIEATGLAYPEKIAKIVDEYLHITPLVITVTDVERWEELNEILEPLVHGQLTSASSVLLNKIDVVSQDVRKAVKESISKINSKVEIFEVCALNEIDKSVWEALINV